MEMANFAYKLTTTKNMKTAGILQNMMVLV